MSIFSFLFVLLFFSSILCIVAKKGKKMKTSSRFLLLRLFLLLLYTTHKEDFWLKTLHDAVIVVVVVIIMVATTISMCIYIYIYIYVCMYFFISIAALAFTLIVMMCTGMLFSAVVVSFSFFVFFFVCFFFDSIDDRNIECFMLSLFSRSSYSLLQSTLVAYSYVFLILHLRVLFRCVPYVYFVLKRRKKTHRKTNYFNTSVIR